VTPEDEREAQCADELVAGLPQDARDQLLSDWAQYLVDREQADLPVRHRDFVLGWIACFDSHELRPRLVHVTFTDPKPAPRPQVPSRQSTLYEKLMETQNKRFSVRVEKVEQHTRTVTIEEKRLSGWFDRPDEPSGTPPPTTP
jgi:hypothetical protein